MCTPKAISQADTFANFEKRSCNRKTAGREKSENEKRSCIDWLKSSQIRCGNASTFSDFSKIWCKITLNPGFQKGHKQIPFQKSKKSPLHLTAPKQNLAAFICRPSWPYSKNRAKIQKYLPEQTAPKQKKASSIRRHARSYNRARGSLTVWIQTFTNKSNAFQKESSASQNERKFLPPTTKDSPPVHFKKWTEEPSL